MIPMSDGIRLATDITVPGRNGRWPVLLSRTPYNKEGKCGTSDRAVIAVQDQRGRFQSEGWNFPFVGCGWDVYQDGKDTVDWFRSQPWCNGKVFTTGGSALGITQNFMAATQPEGLSGQYIVVAAADLYRHAAYVGGAFRKSQVENWCVGNEFDPKTVDIYKAHPSYDRFWSRWDSLAKASEINVPAVHVGGWFDTFALGTVDAYRTRQHQGGPGAKGKQKLVMGPWVHGIGRAVEIAGSHFPDFNVPEAYTQDAWSLSMIGEDDTFTNAANVAYYVMGDVTDPDAPGNQWRHADDWPVPCEPTAFYFHGDGALSTEKPSSEAKDAAHVEFAFDPNDPCPTRGGCNLCIPAGPHKQNDVEDRLDVATFTTEVLEEPVEVTGHPHVHIFLASSAVDTDLSVRLCDVYPDGSSYLMAEGMQRVRYRNSISKPELMEPGKTYEVKVDVWLTSIVFNKGHRIRVAVTSSNYPRFDRNPGTGKPWDVSEEKLTQKNRVYCSDAQCSHIILPVITN
jgi:hypothetical protein